MPRVTSALQGFLNGKRPLHNGCDLLDRLMPYLPYLEIQVNVSADEGQPVEGRRNTYSDGTCEWHNLRIPRNANSNPEFNDYELRWPLEEHAEAIGCTGWDWVSRQSRWVGFDFDSITGHASGVGVTDADLDHVRAAAESLEWIEVRRSTRGRGLHLYVYFQDGVATDNHTEHAALGRAILGMMSSETGFDFARQVDCAGGNMWIWSRHATAENGGLSLVKASTKLLGANDLPTNWRDHVEVVRRERTKVRLPGISDAAQQSLAALAAGRREVALDEQHKAVFEVLKTSGFTTNWIPDHNLLHTHTCALANLMADEDKVQELRLKGLFRTISRGDHPDSPNCFAFPLDGGGWKVYRFSQGAQGLVKEAETWIQDNEGRTCCYFNQIPDLRTAALAAGGKEDPDRGDYVFAETAAAIGAVRALGRELPLPVTGDRETRLRAHRDGRLIVSLRKADGDEGMSKAGWLPKKDYWTQIFSTETASASEAANVDHWFRVVRTPAGQISGIKIRSSDGIWTDHTDQSARRVARAKGFSNKDVDPMMGLAALGCWTVINVPFADPEPGNRQLNLDAVQLAFLPADLDDEELHYSTWWRILEHIGCCLDEAVQGNDWCKEANIRTGAQWLFAWIICMVRDPYCQLPFLFSWGPENSGKSIFWESLKLLFTGGVVEANSALKSQEGYNAELATAILAYVEEIDLRDHKCALPRLKQWVTDKNLAVRKMRCNVFSQASTLHWYMSANDPSFLPLFPGNTRATVLYVPALSPEQVIKKDALFKLLNDEAPHFLAAILRTPLPPTAGRLRVECLDTEEKKTLSQENAPLSVFLSERCELKRGERIAKAELFDAYREFSNQNDHPLLSRVEFGKQLRTLTGGRVTTGKTHAGEGKRRDAYHDIKLLEAA